MSDYNDDDPYTLPELLEMSDEDFKEAVADDLHTTGAHQSPFQDAAVRQRTLTALVDKLWFVDSIVRKQAEDPGCPNERYQKTLAFRRHLISVIDVTERRVDWAQGPSARKVSAWKDLLHRVLDELEDTEFDEILDEFSIPFDVEGMTLRAWIERRRVKDPSRVPLKEAA